MAEPVIKDFNSYTPADLYALLQDVYSSSKGMSEALEDKYPDLPTFERDLVVLHGLPGAIALAAEVDERPLAYVVIRPRRQTRLRHTADLNMGVASEARRQGLGGLILRTGLEQAMASPILEIIYLMVRSDNTPAIRLYEKAGFETLSILQRDTKIGDSYFDGVLMRRFLDR